MIVDKPFYLRGLYAKSPEGGSKMRSNIMVVFLVGVILLLMIPIVSWYCNIEQAFTPNNLIRINVVSR